MNIKSGNVWVTGKHLVLGFEIFFRNVSTNNCNNPQTTTILMAHMIHLSINVFCLCLFIRFCSSFETSVHGLLVYASMAFLSDFYSHAVYMHIYYIYNNAKCITSPLAKMVWGMLWVGNQLSSPSHTAFTKRDVVSCSEWVWEWSTIQSSSFSCWIACEPPNANHSFFTCYISIYDSSNHLPISQYKRMYTNIYNIHASPLSFYSSFVFICINHSEFHHLIYMLDVSHS